MYIVKQKINKKDYYYLRKSIRKGDKVISKCIAYLGKDKHEAERKSKEIIEKIKRGEDIETEKISRVVEAEKSNMSKRDEEVNGSIERKQLGIDELANFCKEKGFVFRSSDLYGGFAGFWDFGPLGIELFNNIKQDWWNWFVRTRNDIVGIDASVISHPRTWKASGHIASFSDVAVICKKCGKATKIDKSEIGKVKCECGGEYDIKGEFSLMFKTRVGSLDAVDAYLRGETAQGIFMDFKIVQQTSRMQLPFGIAQIGRCFRNEIAPRDFLFRSREFHIGEFEFFINPEEKNCFLLDEMHKEVKLKLLTAEMQDKASSLSTDNENSNIAGKPEKYLIETTIGKMIHEKRLDEWHGYWLAEQILWFNSLGLNEIKIREHKKDELSHYSSATFDIDYEYVFGSKEVAGIANRGQYDLTQHEKESGASMFVFDEKYKNKIIPRVIEPTFGIERVFLAILTKAYTYDKKRDYIVLKIPAKLAPIKAAVFPIVKQDEYIQMSEEIVRDLRKEWNIVYDKSGSIGRRYARNDEIGTIACITVDEQSLKDKTITIRDRDTTKQVRVKISELKEIMRRVVNEGHSILEFGKKVSTRVK